MSRLVKVVATRLGAVRHSQNDPVNQLKVEIEYVFSNTVNYKAAKALVIVTNISNKEDLQRECSEYLLNYLKVKYPEENLKESDLLLIL
jgi:hypothetical protein